MLKLRRLSADLSSKMPGTPSVHGLGKIWVGCFFRERRFRKLMPSFWRALRLFQIILFFTAPAKESRTLKWKIAVPDGAGFLKYKAVAATDNLTDGEEGWLPVISRRILVTESMSLPIRNAGTKEFEFTKLLGSGESETLGNRFIHVQVVLQPAWYAVMALPYLMEYPHECSEQTFNR